MTVLSEHENIKINEDANRLRLLHADTAAAAPEKRRDHLQEELERIVKGIPPASRKAYLKALLARFPVGGRLAGSPPPTPVEAPPPRPPRPQTADELLDAFIDAAADLPDEQRAEMSRKLQEKGFGTAAKGTLDMEIGEELRQRFGIPPGHEPDLHRVLELAAWLVDLSWRLDQTTFSVWGELASKNHTLVKRHQDFRAVATRFLSGNDEVIEAHLSAFSTLVGALLVAMQQGPRDFERYYMQRFSPQAVEEIVHAEGVGAFQNRKERCWNRYRELTKDFCTPGVIDKKIKDTFVTIVEATFKGKT